jgi:hypothetical protein
MREERKLPGPSIGLLKSLGGGIMCKSRVDLIECLIDGRRIVD